MSAPFPPLLLIADSVRQAYPYSDPWSLTWPYRRSIILQELNDTQGDILCLQEVQADHYSQSLLPMLSELGYDGLFKQKTRESMGQYGKVDGCAIFWRKSKFSLTENYSLEFNEIVKRNAGQLGLEDSDKHRSPPILTLHLLTLLLQIHQPPLEG
jgi:CCR4-NOT transcription complex subunit 6